MERRGFIKGMLTAIAGATATVKLAEPGEAAALIQRQNLLLSQPEPASLQGVMEAFHGGGLEVYAKTSKGYVNIGYLRSIEVTSARVDELYTWEGDIRGNNPAFVQGMKKITMRFGGPL